MDFKYDSNYLSNTIYHYLNTRISTTGWVFWILILLFVLFILWLFFGGGDYEYVGLAPLKIGVDSTKYVNENIYATIDKSNRNAPKITQSNDTNGGDNNDNNDNNNNDNEGINNFEPSTIGNNNSASFNNLSFNTQNSKNNKKALGIYKQRKNTKMSKGELACKQAIEEIYNKPFYCVRPDFLKNPETKRNLELDLYNDELKIAVERNGIQHYKWPNYTGQTKEQFIEQVRRDEFKREKCDENGVYLITVPYTVEDCDVKDYIKYYLPENHQQRLNDQKNLTCYVDNNLNNKDN